MSAKNKILLIVNPISGNLKKTELTDLIKSELKDRGKNLIIYETNGKDDIQRIDDLINKETPERILIAGGDGTIQLVAEVLKEHDHLPIGIIPAGSANGFAVNLNLPSDRIEQLEIALSNDLLRTDTLLINDKICLHIADLGINAELIKNYKKSKLHGKLGYFLQSIPTLLNSEYPFDFELEINKKFYKKEGILLAIANASKFGTGANINPKGKIYDGKFEVLIFKNLNIIEIFKSLYSEEVDFDSEFVEDVSTTSVKITSKTPVALQIDGEFIGEVTEVIAKVSPIKLLIAVPKEFRKEASIN